MTLAERLINEGRKEGKEEGQEEELKRDSPYRPEKEAGNHRFA